MHVNETYCQFCGAGEGESHPSWCPAPNKVFRLHVLACKRK
jgi:hypothetical protein